MTSVLDFKSPYKSSSQRRISLQHLVCWCLCVLFATFPICSCTNSSLFQQPAKDEIKKNLRSAAIGSSVATSFETDDKPKKKYLIYNPYRIWDTNQYAGFVREYTSSSSSSGSSAGDFDDDLVDTNVQTSVVGGSTVSSITTYPYMTYLYFNYAGVGTRCGGSLIAPNLILTAGHCLPSTTGSDGIKRPVAANPLGSTSRAMLGATYRYDKYADGVQNFGFENYFHPDFYQSGQDPPINDIAIIKLDGCSTFKPVTLNKDTSLDSTNGKQVQIIGWGEEYFAGGGNGGEYLKETSQYIDSSCSYWGTEKTDNMICAAQQGTGPCFGDSGGPLIVKGSGSDGSGDIQLGIVSAGSKCADVSVTPDIYTRISRYTDWIDSIKQANSQCTSSNSVYSSKMYSGSESGASASSGGGTYSPQGYGSGSSGSSYPAATPSASTSIEYLKGAGTVSLGGMFSIQPSTNVIITSLSVNLQNTGTYGGITIYTMSGSPDGYELSSSGWNLIGSATNVQSMGPGVLTPLPYGAFSPISVSAGQILSFYVYSTTQNQNMISQAGLSSEAVGVVYAQSTEMNLIQHSANTDNFGYAWKPYKWNGSVTYTTS